MRAVALRCEHREDVPCIDEPGPAAELGAGVGRARQAPDRLPRGRVAPATAACGTAAGSSPRTLGRHRLRGPGAARRRPSCSGPSQVWDEAGAASELERARALPHRPGASGARSGSGATEPTTPAMPVPGSEPDDRRRTCCCAALRARAVPAAARSTLDARVRRATLYATARGVLRAAAQRRARRRRRAGARLDRLPHADPVPGPRRHRRCCATATTCSAAIVGDGWYAGFVGMDLAARRQRTTATDPELLCELHVEHEDGSARGDRQRRAAGAPPPGPIRVLRPADGRALRRPPRARRLDRARLRRRRLAAVPRAPRDDVALVPERAQPIRVTEELRPVAVTERAPGVHVVDLGQNMVGWVRLRGRGRARHARCGCASPRCSSRTARCTSTTCAARASRTPTCSRGGGAPRSTSRASPSTASATSRSRASDRAAPDTITGRVVHSDTPRSGWFECSDELVNQLWRNINWGQRGNFVSVPTDCPQRDERLGWLADAQVFLPTATLNMDVAAFFTKWGDDVLDAQSPEGAYPDVAPRLVARARRRAGVGRRRRDRAVDRSGARYGDRAARSSATGTRWSATWPTSAPQPRPAVAARTRQRLRRLAVGRRRHAARRARDRLLGLRRAAHGARWPRVLGRPDRAEHYDAPARRRSSAAFNRAYVGDDALHRGRHPDRLPARAALGPAAGGAARAGRRAPRRRTSSATTAT